MNPCSADTVFSTLEAMCLAEGGDGDSVLVAPNPLDLAFRFDAWQRAKATPSKPAWWAMTVHGDEACFHNNQEAIHFLKARPAWGWYVYLVELPHGKLFLE
jgi:hypothetical protein